MTDDDRSADGEATDASADAASEPSSPPASEPSSEPLGESPNDPSQPASASTDEVSTSTAEKGDALAIDAPAAIQPVDDDLAKERALQLRIACGVLASATRFVPVPFLDDYLRDRAFQLMVSRTLRARGRTIGSASIAPFYEDPTGCLYGCLMATIVFPFKLMFGWVLSVLMGARNLSRDLSQSVLLGRVLDRRLDAGEFENGTDKKVLKASAAQLRAAFDLSVRGTDMVLLRGVLTKAVASIQGLLSAGFRSLRGLRKEGSEDPTAGMSPADREKVKESSRRIQKALDTPEMRAFFVAFDARFDENLAKVIAGTATLHKP